MKNGNNISEYEIHPHDDQEYCDNTFFGRIAEYLYS